MTFSANLPDYIRDDITQNVIFALEEDIRDGDITAQLIDAETGHHIWADKFDHLAAVTNFIIMPLSFPSGTFYSIQRLPEAVQIAAHFNPFFYMIDGLRYGFIGHADGSLTLGLLVMAAVNAGLWALSTWMFATGYKLKA